MSAEEWRPISGYEGHYGVSDQGRVWSWKTGRILRPALTSTGYPRVKLCRDGEVVPRKVHHIVMDAFVGPRPEGMQVRHLDGDPTNNALTNLAYGTPAENIADQVRHGTHYWAAKTECANGHEFTPENTWMRTTPTGAPHRVCRICARARDRQRERARKRRRAARSAASAGVSAPARPA